METDSKPFGMKPLFFVCILLICSAPAARGQSLQTDEIRWAATGFTDKLSNTVVSDAPCQFVTHETQQVEWIQGDGAYVVTLQVTGTSGSWTDLAQPGTIVLSVSGEGVTGSITFSRSGGGITAELYLTGGTVDIRNLYTIASLETL